MITVQKDPARDFVILNLTDIHLSQPCLDPENEDRKFLFSTIDTLIRRAKPDLITITGDLGYGDRPGFAQLCGMFSDWLAGYGIPWAMCWGNHDDKAPEGLLEQVEQRLHESPLFLFEAGDEAMGRGNYVLTVEENGRPIQGLLFMDGHNYAPFQRPDGTWFDAYERLWPNQLRWYEEQVEALRQRGCGKTMILVHVPIYAYHQALAAALKPGVDPLAVTPAESGTGACWNEGYEDSFGVSRDEISSYPAEDGVFDLIRRLGSTQLVLAGHDHSNCTCIRYQGVRLAYGLKTGRGSGCTGLNGGTVLRLRSDGSVTLEHLYL